MGHGLRVPDGGHALGGLVVAGHLRTLRRALSPAGATPGVPAAHDQALRRPGSGGRDDSLPGAAVVLATDLRRAGPDGDGAAAGPVADGHGRLQLSDRAVHRLAQHAAGFRPATGQRSVVRRVGDRAVAGVAMHGRQRGDRLRRGVAGLRRGGDLLAATHLESAARGRLAAIARASLVQTGPLRRVDAVGEPAEQPVQRGRSLHDRPLFRRLVDRGPGDGGRLPQLPAWCRCCWSRSRR